MKRRQIIAGCVAAAAIVAFAGSLASAPVAGPAPAHLSGRRVETLPVQSRAVPLNPHDPGQERVGRLRYLGGLVLTSTDSRFGGISGLLWDAACRRLLAASDDGRWFILEPKEENGRLIGIGAGWTAAFRRPGDVPIERKSDVDAEALARDSEGQVWAFFEQVHRAERFPGLNACQPETLAAVPDRTWMLPHTEGWAMNGGAEAAAGMGRELVYLSETSTTIAGAADRRGVIGSPDADVSAARVFAYQVPAGFSPTDMVALNGDGRDGRMLILHRRLSGLGGLSALLAEAQIPLAGAGAVHPQELARLAAPLTVDNMEALAIRAEGERRFIYLMSDDNFRSFQRTLLLKFELLPADPP